MRKRRLFASILAIVMCVSVCSVTAFAENTDAAAESASIEETIEENTGENVEENSESQQ